MMSSRDDFSLTLPSSADPAAPPELRGQDRAARLVLSVLVALGGLVAVNALASSRPDLLPGGAETSTVAEQGTNAPLVEVSGQVVADGY